MFVGDKGLHGMGDFIVKYMFAGKHTRVMESQEEQRIGMGEFCIRMIFDGLDKDCAGIDVNQDHEVVVA